RRDLDAALRGYSAARAIDERLLAANPNSKRARTDLGFDLSDLATTLESLKRPTEAADAFDKVIALRRDAYAADINDVRARRPPPAILLRRGRLWARDLNKPATAIPALREASRLWSADVDRLEPQRGEAEYELAVIYERLGDTREAEGHRATA